MKKVLITVLSGILTLSLVGCGSTKKVENPEGGKPNVKVEEPKKEEKEQPPITIEEVPMNVTILEPDSIGNRYMEATFTNNSKYAIKGFNVTVLLKDKNEKTYLSNFDTVMSGETSPKFQTFGPDTGNADDLEYLEYEITVVDESGKEIYLTYDVKLKTYKWY